MDVLENDFRRVGQADAHLIFFLADRNAWAVPFDDESRNAFDALCLVGNGKDRVDRSDAAVGDEAFRAVQYVFIALFDSDCRPGCRIGAGIGFGQAESAETAALFTGQVFGIELLLGIRAVLEYRFQAQAGSGNSRSDTGVDFASSS